MGEVINNWLSVCQNSKSQLFPNSQMVASFSCITLNLPSDVLPVVLDEMPLFSEDFIQGANAAKLYDSQDFDHLIVEMFEDSGPE